MIQSATDISSIKKAKSTTSLIVTDESRPNKARKDGIVRESDAAFTIQARVHLLSFQSISDILDDNAAEYCRLERCLYAAVYHSGGSPRDYKQAFCEANDILARQFNSLAASVGGMISSVNELNKDALISAKKNLINAKAELARLDSQREKLRINHMKFETRAGLSNFHKKIERARIKVIKLNAKIEHLEEQLAAHAPSVAFGTKRLFRRQFHLEANGYKSHDEWLADWQIARNNHIYCLGSHDETAGNSNCQLTVYAPGIDAVNIKLKLLPVIAEKYKDSGLVDKLGCITINRVYFMRGFAHLLTAIDLGEAITVRMHKDSVGWMVSATFDRRSATVVTKPAQAGAIGIDFNQDHLAVTETDKNGNLLHPADSPSIDVTVIKPAIRLNIPLNYKKGMTTGQREAILSDALSEVVEYAAHVKKPIVIEDLDFARKKELMTNKPKTSRNAKRHYQLSTLSYSKYLSLLKAKCRFIGVQLIRVKAAYTSVLGAVKYAKTRGLSVHGSAALVITRRGQGFIEALPKTSEVVVPVNGTTVQISLPEGLRSRNERSAALRAIAKVYRDTLFNYFKELNLQKSAEASLGNSMSTAYRR